MKVYGIYEGCKYEGGGVKGTLYMNQQDAIQSLDEFVADYNSYWEDEDGVDYADMRYQKTSDVLYETSCDIICVKEFELI